MEIERGYLSESLRFGRLEVVAVHFKATPSGVGCGIGQHKEQARCSAVRILLINFRNNLLRAASPDFTVILSKIRQQGEQ